MICACKSDDLLLCHIADAVFEICITEDAQSLVCLQLLSAEPVVMLDKLDTSINLLTCCYNTVYA